jgi:exosortase
MMARNVAFALLCTLAVLCVWSPLTILVHLALNDDRYVTVLAAPLISAIILYWERTRIFRYAVWDALVGLPLIAIGLSVSAVVLKGQAYSDQGFRFAFAALALLLTGAGAFVLCYGRSCFQAALFPFCCLLSGIPLPTSALDRITTALQYWSAATSVIILHLTGVPIFAQGTRLSLPGLELQVAPECSGIRSCLALLLITVLVSRLCLRKGGNRLAFVLSAIPLAVLKNALRISALAVLSVYVDHDILRSPLHRYGGLVFTPFEIGLLAGLLAILRRLESIPGRAGSVPAPSESVDTTLVGAK